VSNDSISEPNATGTTNITGQPSQQSEVVGAVRTTFADLFTILDNTN
jgi:hypothetical protein